MAAPGPPNEVGGPQSWAVRCRGLPITRSRRCFEDASSQLADLYGINKISRPVNSEVKAVPGSSVENGGAQNGAISRPSIMARYDDNVANPDLYGAHTIAGEIHLVDKTGEDGRPFDEKKNAGKAVQEPRGAIPTAELLITEGGCRPNCWAMRCNSLPINWRPKCFEDAANQLADMNGIPRISPHVNPGVMTVPGLAVEYGGAQPGVITHPIIMARYDDNVAHPDLYGAHQIVGQIISANTGEDGGNVVEKKSGGNAVQIPVPVPGPVQVPLGGNGWTPSVIAEPPAGYQSSHSDLDTDLKADVEKLFRIFGLDILKELLEFKLKLVGLAQKFIAAVARSKQKKENHSGWYAGYSGGFPDGRWNGRPGEGYPEKSYNGFDEIVNHPNLFA